MFLYRPTEALTSGDNNNRKEQKKGRANRSSPASRAQLCEHSRGGTRRADGHTRHCLPLLLIGLEAGSIVVVVSLSRDVYEYGGRVNRGDGAP